MAPPTLPGPSTTVVCPDKLICRNIRAVEPDGELQVDVRVFDLDYLEKDPPQSMCSAGCKTMPSLTI